MCWKISRKTNYINAFVSKRQRWFREDGKEMKGKPRKRNCERNCESDLFKGARPSARAAVRTLIPAEIDRCVNLS